MLVQRNAASQSKSSHLANCSCHRKSLFVFVEDDLKEQGMEHTLPPTAKPEESKSHFENCKIVLKDRVLHHWNEDGREALKRVVLTWARVVSWGEINEHGTPSDEDENGPQGSCDKKRK